MIIKCLPNGMFDSNCYIIIENNKGIIIDPGVGSKYILDLVEKNEVNIEYIILTHGHIDHICSVDEVRESTKAKVLIHEEDAAALTDAQFNGSVMFTGAKSFKKADGFIKDGDILDVDGLTIEIMHTPGHTPGGICIKAGDNVFTGDTLFRRTVGRTDLGNGNHYDLINSIKGKLLTLSDTVTVYPGHGEYSTIGFERKNNPFLI